jgi:hypothetical protein
MLIRSAKELEVYRKAFDLAMLIFRVSQSFPAEERYALTSQIRRSSRSVALTDTALDFARSCDYISAEQHTHLTTRSAEIGRMVGSMLQNPSPFLKSRRPEKVSDF